MNDAVLFRMQVDSILERACKTYPGIDKEVKAEIEEIKTITRLEMLGLDLVGKMLYDAIKKRE